MERFLRELGTGHIDTLLMHNVETVEDLDARAPCPGSPPASQGAAGKVRAVGLSTHLGSGAIMDACADRPQIEVVLTTVNRDGLMLKNATLEQHLPLVQRVFEARKAICLMKTLAQGRLARTPD